MTPAHAAELLALLAAALSSAPLAVRLPAHRPLAAALCALAAVDVVRLGTEGPPLGTGPVTWRWAADVGLVGAWYVVEAWVVWGVLGKGSR